MIESVPTASKLGEDVRFVKCHFHARAKGETYFASSVCFLVGQVQTDQAFQEELLLEKYNIADEIVRMWLNLGNHFRNDMAVYEKYLSLFDRDGTI